MRRTFTGSTTRLALGGALIVIALAGVAFGAFAAWSVTTENNSNTVSTGSVHHSNATQYTTGGALGNTTCTDTTSPASCGMIVTMSGMKPGDTKTGTLTISNTGTLASSFVMSQPSNATPTASSSESGHTTLCSNLTLQIVDNEGTPATLYNSGLVMGATTVTLKSSTGATSWASSASGVFTFTLTLPSSSPYTDENATCTSTFLVTQTNS
ncbi:MAG: hypothetical protein ABR498_02835 [Candidatus Dormibacteria bacterium]